MSEYWRAHTLGRQTHLGISESEFESQYDRVVYETSKFLYDNRIEEVASFGADGYDGHPGHKLTNMVMWASVDEVSRLGHSMEVLEINSAHAGVRRYEATDESIDDRMRAMGSHITQWYVGERGPGSFQHEVMVTGRAVRTDTWMMWAEGGVLELVEKGETYDAHAV
jgi:hypothetical protein